MKDKKIAFLGAGFMGSAIIRGLVRSGKALPGNISVFDLFASALTSLENELSIKVADNAVSAVSTADLVILAVKPQVLGDLLGEVGDNLGGRLVVSIAAGIKTETIESKLPSDSRVVRVMPNMGAEVGSSATAVCRGKNATQKDADLVMEIFGAVGEVIQVDETLMDAVTALAGSGPAFVFLFMEGLIDAGVRCGLPRQSARTLAFQTVAGAVSLAVKSDKNLADLKESITSPGGTTIAGLAYLESAGFKGTIIRAVEESANRSKELGN